MDEDKLLYEKLCRLIVAKFEDDPNTQVFANYNSHTRPEEINNAKPDVVIINSEQKLYFAIEIKSTLTKDKTKNKWVNLSTSSKIKNDKKAKFCVLVQKKDYELAKEMAKAWNVFVDLFYTADI